MINSCKMIKNNTLGCKINFYAFLNENGNIKYGYRCEKGAFFHRNIIFFLTYTAQRCLLDRFSMILLTLVTWNFSYQPQIQINYIYHLVYLVANLVYNGLQCHYKWSHQHCRFPEETHIVSYMTFCFQLQKIQCTIKIIKNQPNTHFITTFVYFLH